MKEYSLELLSTAEEELNDSFEWYEKQRDELGHEFINEVSHYPLVGVITVPFTIWLLFKLSISFRRIEICISMKCFLGGLTLCTALLVSSFVLPSPRERV